MPMATAGNTSVVSGTKTAANLRWSPYFASASSASMVRAGRAAEAAMVGLNSGAFGAGLGTKHHRRPESRTAEQVATRSQDPLRAMASGALGSGFQKCCSLGLGPSKNSMVRRRDIMFQHKVQPTVAAKPLSGCCLRMQICPKLPAFPTSFIADGPYFLGTRKYKTQPVYCMASFKV